MFVRLFSSVWLSVCLYQRIRIWIPLAGIEYTLDTRAQTGPSTRACSRVTALRASWPGYWTSGAPQSGQPGHPVSGGWGASCSDCCLARALRCSPYLREVTDTCDFFRVGRRDWRSCSPSYRNFSRSFWRSIIVNRPISSNF